MGSIQDSLRFFEAQFASYNTISKKLSPIAETHADLLAARFNELKQEQIDRLPLMAKTRIFSKQPRIPRVLITKPVAQALLAQKELNPELKEVSASMLYTLSEDGTCCTIQGREITRQDILELVIQSIKEEARKKVTALDLSEAHINNLKTLLEAFPSVSKLKLSRTGLTSLEGIDALAATLQELDASGNATLKSLDGLEACKKLAVLNLAGSSILEDFSPLQALPLLRQLDLSNCPRSTDEDGYGPTSLQELKTLNQNLKNLIL